MYKTIDKYWGTEDWIEVNKDYAFKRLTIFKGKTLLSHYHAIKEETFYVASGVGIITVNGIMKRASSGDIFHIHPFIKHEIVAFEEMVVLEASTPFLEDSIREAF